MTIQLKSLFINAKDTIRKKFKSATFSFLFTMVFVNIFIMIFGSENTILGVVIAILMPSSMLKDFTAAPIKNFLTQTIILESIILSSFLVMHINPYFALFINFAVLFFILYTFTFEYSTHMYMPYILSYLFLIFISQVTPALLPKRLLAGLVGGGCMILYHFAFGHNRTKDTVLGSLVAMIDEAKACIQCLLTQTGKPADPETVHNNVTKLCQLIYDRRKSILCVSSADFALLDCSRGLEKLILVLYDLEGHVTPEIENLLKYADRQLDLFRRFLYGESEFLSQLDYPTTHLANGTWADTFYDCLVYIHGRLLHVSNPIKRSVYHKTLLSFSERLKSALNISPVRVVYGLRIAFLLTICTFIVQQFHLTYGKWLLFTLASVSLPYAEDYNTKAGKRLFATLLGGIVSLVGFALIPSISGRTVFMLTAGYFTSYFGDYKYNFACSTVGALGGAVMTTYFGWGEVGSIFLIRCTYVCLGIAIGLVINCMILPFKRQTAGRQLWNKYLHTIHLLLHLCHEKNKDLQLYYSLVIQSHLQEAKLRKDIVPNDFTQLQKLDKFQQQVREASIRNLNRFPANSSTP